MASTVALKTPKYARLAETLRAQITSGTAAPGERLPSFAQMRIRYQATQATVEKALGLLEREGLIVRRSGSGIYVAQPEKNLSRRKKPRSKSGIIGVSGLGFAADAAASYWTDLLGGMRRAASNADVHLLLLDHASSHGWEKADGVLVCDWTAHDILDRVAPSQPCVSVLVDVAGRSSVVADDYMGGYLATRHLLDLGHRRIAYLHGGAGVSSRRLAGYWAALNEVGIVAEAGWTRTLSGKYFDSADFIATAHRHMTAWLDEGWRDLRCTSILAHNDATAIGVMEALRQKGLEVPGDVSVVGFDGTDICRHSSPPLTTVKLPLAEIGARSVEVLLAQIERDTVSNEHCVLPVQILAQGSTAPSKLF